MAGLFCDSFDHYSTSQITRKWTQESAGYLSITRTLANGRRGTAGYNIAMANGPVDSGSSQRLGVALPASGATCIAGMAFLTTNPQAIGLSTIERLSSALFAVQDSGVSQVWFRLNNDGTISAYRAVANPGDASVLLATTSQPIADNIRTYVEFKVTVDPTSGVVQVRFDGIQVMNFSGNTRNTANTSWNGVRAIWLGAGANVNCTWNMDDFYVCDGSGSDNNDFLGDVRVDAQFGSADGDHEEWTRSAGADSYALVDDNPANDDTDYVSAVNTGTRDTFSFGAAPVSGAPIAFLQLNTTAAKTDAGSAALKGLLRASSTDYLTSDERGVTSSYSVVRHIYQENPDTSAPFDDGDFPIQLGFQKTQ